MTPGGKVVLADINEPMLQRGRDRLLDAGMPASAIRCNAEQMPFVSDHFDCITMGFGLRNVTHKDNALREMHRLLRPGGRLVVLEFSRVHRALAPLYDAYSFGVLPLLGRLVARDASSYRYLAESIRVHPDQNQLRDLFVQAGFEFGGRQMLHVGHARTFGCGLRGQTPAGPGRFASPIRCRSPRQPHCMTTL